MSVDKGVMQAPQGLAGLLGDNDGDEQIIVIQEGEDEPEEKDNQPTPEFDANIAEGMDEKELQALASDLHKDYEDDLQSRKEWTQTYIDGLKLLGLKYEKMTEPWTDACGVFHPLLMEAAVKFQSECIMETFPAAGPVRTMIIGKETQQKKDAAKRVQEDMNYELTECMSEYRPEHERLLLSLALSGNGFKKIYFDPALDRQSAMFIPAEDIVVPYGAANIETAERITHRMRKTKNELKKLQHAGFYLDKNLGEPVIVMDEIEKQQAEKQGVRAVVDNRYQLLEMHVELDLKGHEDKDDKEEPTGIKLPYVVTIEKGTKTCLAIRRNWREDDPVKQRRRHFVHYGYIPSFGFYYYGLIHLIGGHTQAATSLLRQLVDAGTLSNLPGGVKTRGFRAKGDETPIRPGEFRDVDVPSGAIKDNIMVLPYKEPSIVLMQLMDKIVEEGKQFSGAGDLNISDMSAQAPVGTTLALLERVLKVMSAVQARVHFTMKQEFKLLAAIIRDNTPSSYDYDPETGDAGAKQSDYDCCEILPVSDPNASTMAQRIIQYQAVLQLAGGTPQIYNMPFLHRQMIETIGVKNAQKIVPLDEDMKPVDPVSENMDIMNGKPVKAFMYQDHQSHLAVHMAAMQDPKLQALIGQNPNAQAIMSAGAAHMMQHLAFEYRAQLQQKLGGILPPPPNKELDEGYLDPETETQVAQLAAVAAQQLLAGNQAEARAAQVQQQQNDPIVQMQQQELQIKQQELQIKQKQAQDESQLKQQDLQIKQLEYQTQQQVANASVTEAQLQAQIKQLQFQLQQKQLESATAKQAQDHQRGLADIAAKADDMKLREQEQQHQQQMDQHQQDMDRQDKQMEGARLGVEIAKTKVDQQQQHHQSALDAVKHVASLDVQASEGAAQRKHELAKTEIERSHEREIAARQQAHELKVSKQQAEQAKKEEKSKSNGKEKK